jgi:hypothetical protein
MIPRITLLVLTSFFCCRAISAAEKKIIDGVTYHVLITPASSVRIIWKDAADKQLRTFPEVAHYLAGK